MSEVRVEVRRTRGDIFRGILANSLHSLGALAWFVGGSFVVAVIAALANSARPAPEMLFVGATAFVVMLLVYAVVLLFSIWLAARQTWRASGALDTIRYTFSDQGLAIEAVNGRGLSHWHAFKRAFETKSLLLIRHHVNMVHILPKRDMGADTLERIRAVLRAHIKDVRVHPTERAA